MWQQAKRRQGCCATSAAPPVEAKAPPSLARQGERQERQRVSPKTPHPKGAKRERVRPQNIPLILSGPYGQPLRLHPNDSVAASICQTEDVRLGCSRLATKSEKSDDPVSPLPGVNPLKPTFVHLSRCATYIAAGADVPKKAFQKLRMG